MADSFTPEQIENMNKFFELINSSVEPMTLAQREELELAKQAKNAKERLDQFGKQVGKAGLDFTKALVSGKEGFAKFGTSINDASTAAGNFVSSFGLLGAVTGGLIKIFGTFTDNALKQNDNLMKGYADLSALGSVTRGGLRGLQDDLSKIGLTSEEYEKLAKLLQPLTQDLAAFGGSVTQGKTQLLNVISGFIGIGNPLETSLRRLGYSTEDIREGIGDYISMQTRLGRAQGKTTEQLTKESHKYLVEMKGLQELTGMTRDEQQKLRDAQMTDARYSLHLSQMNADEAKNLQNYMIVYEKSFGPEAAAGLKDRIVNFGRITTEQGAASYQRGNQEYENAMKAQREGSKVFQDMIVDTGRRTMQRLKPLEGTFRLADGSIASMGFNAKLVNGALAVTNTNANNYADTMKELLDISNREGDQLDLNIKGDQQDRARRLMYDKLLTQASKGLIEIFAKLKDIMTSFARMVARAIDFITNNTPGGVFTPTNLSQFFDEAFPETGPSTIKPGPGRSLSANELARSQAEAAKLEPSMQGRKAEDILNKLNFGGQRAERTGGGESSLALLALAEKINDQFPGVIITALNDVYHQGSRNPTYGSKHRIGRALDFALPYNPTDDEGDVITKQLRMMGASNAINEYKEHSKNWTGGHFHVEVARHGGLFSGRDAGYPVMLHGNESVWPEKDLTSFMKDVQKTSLETYKKELMTKIAPTNAGDNLGTSLVDALSRFGTKLDTLISEQRTTNNIQNEILTYTRA